MKKLLLFAVIVTAMLAAACSKYKYESFADDPMKTRIYTLPNGLKVYMTVNSETPRIQTAIAVRVGGKNDPSETTGLAHYFEHLMFKGTEQFGTSDYAAEKPLLDEIEQLFETYRRTDDEAERAAIYRRIDSISYEASKISIPNEYDKLMSAIGAEGTNAFTSQDMTVYVEDIPSNEIDTWAMIQADRFKHPVIRGFHTELETIYEEKNMSLTKDSRKVWEALDAALFPHHPYGTQTVLGTQEHLKNPSITNVKNYHKTWYVPNNMAVCVSGDFDPDEMIATIDKYFGDMQPNPELPKLTFEPEAPITEPVVREVFGPDAENVTIGWRLPEAVNRDNEVATIAGSVLYNGTAGLIDFDIIQRQKALSAYAYASTQPDYGTFVAAGRPKQGQTLEEVRDLLLAEVEKLRAGDFDEKLIESTVNNYKKGQQQQLEDNNSRALSYVYSFINGADWADEVKSLDRIATITKEDVVAWANEYLRPENFAIVYKRLGTDPNEQKIAAPKITPIATNRDMQSDFLVAVQQREVKPIEPRFVDFERDMAQFDLRPGVHVLYKKNELNDLFTLQYTFDTGTMDNSAFALAFDYLSYLGTDKMTAEEIASEFYNIACSFSMWAGNYQTTINISGLGENMGRAVELVESLLTSAVPDEEILASLKADRLKSRADAKLNQARCFSALRQYVMYGADFVRRSTLDNAALEALTSEQLLAAVRSLLDKQHELTYYGPASKQAFGDTMGPSTIWAADLQPLERRFIERPVTTESRVVLAPYDAKQIYYIQYSNRGERYDAAAEPVIELYDNYFGGGMNSVVFQEMREARGLAYSAWAQLFTPSFATDTYSYNAFIATQNDKMRQAIEAFDEIIEQMPSSEAAFDLAKESLITGLRTRRWTGWSVLSNYCYVRDMGLKESPARAIFEALPALTLDDVKAAQEQWVKGRPYVYAILGDAKDLDIDYLKTLGKVDEVTLTDIFGY